MSTDSQTEDGPKTEPKKSKRKLMLIAGGAALAVVLAGGAGYVFLLGPKGDSVEVLQAEVEPAFFYDLPTMTVNLATSSESTQFLKLSVALELESEVMAQAIEPRIARVLDAFQVYLRELRRSDLEGSAGVYRLKEELRRRVNLAIYPAEVDGVLFKEIIIQ